MNDKPLQSNRNVILHKIIHEEVSMRPKALFRLRMALVIVSIALITLISVFLFSFISFLIRMTNQNELLRFGLSGLKSFVFLFPWFLFLIDIALVAFLGYLLRQFRFGYQRSVIYFSLGIVALVAIFGIGIDRETSIHDALLHSADAGTLPVLSGFYERARAPLPHTQGVCRCVITGTAPLTARDDTGSEEFPVLLSGAAPAPTLSSGDHVFMLGTFSNQAFYANRIRVENQE